MVMAADLFSILKENTYPGRGIVLGKTEKHAVVAYFIMGRSENSRNRIFAYTQDGIRTEAFDPAKLSDPSLIIYSPVRMLGEQTVVTNGDQTDTIIDSLQKGESFEQALRTRTFEPDAPNYTPRISGIMSVKKGDCDFKLSILKSNQGNPQASGDGNPIPSFCGEPVCVDISDSIDIFSDSLWNSLNNDNKVSLFVCYSPLDGGTATALIFNKNQK